MAKRNKKRDKKGRRTRARATKPEAQTLWARSRSGSHAGRGFHYQDAVATELALEHLSANTLRRVIPEGLDDVSLELDAGWVHVQAKSRRESRGPFQLSELRGVWRALAERLTADDESRALLVLERPIAELGDSSETPDGGSSATRGLASLRPHIARELNGLGLPLDDFFARLTIEIRPAAPETALQLLSHRLALPPASCQAHYSALRAEIATKADINGERDLATAATLGKHDLERVLAATTEAVDPSALDEALRNGLCELVDFRTPLADERFYRGMDALPGHVVAGLVLERPELSKSLLDAMAAGRSAIVAGPSGAGKSALLWLTAWETRHRITWYRVPIVQSSDAVTIARFARGCMPSEASAIGFIVDDVGTDGREGWDQLVRELSTIEHANLLGACREENLFLLTTAGETAQVRPELDEVLATRIYDELDGIGGTRWQHWREPYEQSNRLLLEYSHLLSAGERLEATIKGQVARRLREGRELELEVLRLVATAHAFGAAVDINALQAHLGTGGPELQAAMARLIEEHLLQSPREGQLQGLHELRSRALVAEVHLLPPASLHATAEELTKLLQPSELQAFLTRLLIEHPAARSNVVRGVAERIRTAPRADVLAAALQALQLAGFQGTAAAWAIIISEEDASVADAVLLSHFALDPQAEVDIFPEPVQRAVVRMRAEAVDDFRDDLLTQLEPAVLNRAIGESALEDVLSLVAALRGAPLTPSSEALYQRARDLKLDEQRELLALTYEARPSLAQALADRMGGERALIERLERELPWVRHVALDVDGTGLVVAKADYVFVSEAVESDPHSAVVNLCTYLLALAPSAHTASSRALDARGELAGIGIPIAEKQIPRENLATDAAVAWNRARCRALIAAVAAHTYTDRLLREREIVERATEVAARAAHAYLTGEGVEEALAWGAVLGLMAKSLSPPPPAIEAVGPRESGTLLSGDPAGFVGTTIGSNLIPRLFDEGPDAALVIPGIVDQLDELSNSAHWSLLDGPPNVEQLRRTLLDLHLVLREAAAAGIAHQRVLRATSGGGSLRRAAEVARRRVAARLRTLRQDIRGDLSRNGHQCQVISRASELDSPYWPQDELLVLVEVETILAWGPALDDLVAIVSPRLTNSPPFLMAPVRDERIVGSCAVRVIGGNPHPAVHDLGSWPELPSPLLAETAREMYTAAVDSLADISAILAALRPTSDATGVQVHDHEFDQLQATRDRASESFERFRAFVAEHPHDELLAEAEEVLIAFAESVEDESDARNEGGPPWTGLACELLNGLDGSESDLWTTHLGAVALLIEWDIDPQEAGRMLLAAAPDDTGAGLSGRR